MKWKANKRNQLSAIDQEINRIRFVRQQKENHVLIGEYVFAWIPIYCFDTDEYVWLDKVWERGLRYNPIGNRYIDWPECNPDHILFSQYSPKGTVGVSRIQVEYLADDNNIYKDIVK